MTLKLYRCISNVSRKFCLQKNYMQIELSMGKILFDVFYSNLW